MQTKGFCVPVGTEELKGGTSKTLCLWLTKKGKKLLRSPPAQHSDIDEQDYVHHKGVNDGGNSDSVIIEDERAGGYSDGLRCILHANLNDHGAALATGQAEKARQEGCTGRGTEQQCRHADAHHTEIVGYGAAVLNEEDACQQYQCRKGKPGEYALNLRGCPWPSMPDADTYNDRQKHQQQRTLPDCPAQAPS